MNTPKSWLFLNLLSFTPLVFTDVAHAMTPPSSSAQVSPRSSVTGLSTPTGDGIGFNLTVRNMSRKKLISGQNRVSNPDSERSNTWITTLQSDYRFSDRWTAILSVPYKDTSSEFRDATTGARVKQRTKGLGDVSLLAKLSLYRNRVVNPSGEVFGLFGLEFPTGSTDERDGAGNRLPITEQPGSGEIDYILGVAGVRVFDAFTGYGDLSYQRNGESNYRYGDFLAANLGVNRTLASAPALSLTGELNSEFAAHDTSRRGGAGVIGNTVQNTGSTRLYLTPGVQWRPGQSWVLNAGIQVPIYQRVTGTQLASGLNYTLGAYARFFDHAAAQ